MDTVLDEAELRARMDGEDELLRELVHLFFQNCPNMLSDIHQAVGGGDGARLRRAAHTLKGAVSNFVANGAVEAALRLERMAEQGHLTDARVASAALEHEIHRLKRALLALLESAA